MKMIIYLIGFSSVCLACNSQRRVYSPLSFEAAYSVTALRNDSIWFGKAYADNAFVSVNQPCTANRFDLNFATDIPHSRGSYNHSATITGCMEKCLPTQLLGFSGIPLTIGYYTLADLDSCQGHYKGGAGYMLLDGGDVAAVEFKGFQGWLEVTTYNKENEELTGKFDVVLRTAKGEVVRFSEGSFKVKLIAN